MADKKGKITFKKLKVTKIALVVVVLVIVATMIVVPIFVHNRNIKNKVENNQIETTLENSSENSAENEDFSTEETSSTTAKNEDVSNENSEEVEIKNETSENTSKNEEANPNKESGEQTPVKPKPTNPSKPKPTNPSKPKPTKPTPKPQPEPKPTQPSKRLAGKGDEEAVAMKVMEYVNEFRVQEGHKPAKILNNGKTKQYLKLRSQQLTTHFAHDTDEEREVAGKIKYGEYTDLREHGLPDSTIPPYYEPTCMEAITGSGEIGTIDEVALDIALHFKNSQGHWRYIGAVNHPYENYNYIACAITYVEHDYQFGWGNAAWYVDIATTDQPEYD